jgi:hypothetical protein
LHRIRSGDIFFPGGSQYLVKNTPKTKNPRCKKIPILSGREGEKKYDGIRTTGH